MKNHSPPRKSQRLVNLQKIYRLVAFLIIVITKVSLTNLSNAYSNQESKSWFEVQRIEAGDLGLTDFSGLGYLPSNNAFFSLDQSTQNLTVFTIRGDLLTFTTNVINISNPLNFDYNPQSFGFYNLENGREFVEYQADSSGDIPLPNQKDNSFGLTVDNMIEPKGITFNPKTGDLFILDANGPYIIGYGSVNNGDNSQNTQIRQKLQNVFSNEELNLEGLAYNVQDNNFYSYNKNDHSVYVINNNGNIDSILDISELIIDNFSGISIAPSSDLTDDSTNMNLFIAESRSTQENATVYEISIEEVEYEINADEILQTSLINIIDGSVWDPPNPDASGLEFLIHENRLMVSDSEVEEMPPYYEGVNVFETTNTGSLVKTCDTTHFSVEPSGAAANPDNNHRFFADDNKRKIFEVHPGPDAIYCTSDDFVTSIDTLSFNDDDPEGVAYGDGRLFVTDGVGREVNVIHWGSNGIFDGLPPAGDDTWTHFNTSSIGLRDPEGIGYHWERGTIFMVSRGDDILVETTITGSVLNVYDISHLNIYSPAGVGIGPGSTDPSVMNIYISDRGVDNNQDPNENDGKIYEVYLGEGGTPPDPTNTPLPTATFTPTATATNTLLPTATFTPTATATNTPLPTATFTPTATATNTDIPTSTFTPTATATNTPLPTATFTPTATATNTPLPTATFTPTATATNTDIPTSTFTPTATATNTPLPTATFTPTATATNTPLPSATFTPTATATNTPQPTAIPDEPFIIYFPLVMNGSSEVDNSSNIQQEDTKYIGGVDSFILLNNNNFGNSKPIDEFATITSKISLMKSIFPKSIPGIEFVDEEDIEQFDNTLPAENLTGKLNLNFDKFFKGKNEIHSVGISNIADSNFKWLTSVLISIKQTWH